MRIKFIRLYTPEKGLIVFMKETYWIFTSKSGTKFVQTKSKYLAHALSYCRFQFLVFKDKDGKEFYSFHYNKDLLKVINNLNEIRMSQYN